MKYQPNYSDSRVQKRILHALGFTLAVLHPDKPSQWSTRYIDKFFGVQSNPLSKYLRHHLLTCVDHSYTQGKNHCKSYCSNPVGIQHIQNQIRTEYTSEHTLTPTHIITGNPRQDLAVVGRFVEREYGAELRSGEFSYTDKQFRLWHNLQNVRSVYRKPILSNYGYQHHYDIKSCAPTLLSQYSRQLGNDIWMGAIDYYLENTTGVRSSLATETETDIKTIKVLINSLFCGAQVSLHTDSSIYCLMDSDASRVMYLKQHPYLTELRSDIKTIWEYINPEIPRRRDAQSNRLKRITSSDRWRIYFYLECLVMTHIRRYLSDKHIRFFNEHDGWCSDTAIDIAELTQVVYEQTGFQLEIQHAV